MKKTITKAPEGIVDIERVETSFGTKLVATKKDWRDVGYVSKSGTEEDVVVALERSYTEYLGKIDENNKRY